jgi:hypothetical protein
MSISRRRWPDDPRHGAAGHPEGQAVEDVDAVDVPRDDPVELE